LKILHNKKFEEIILQKYAENYNNANFYFSFWRKSKIRLFVILVFGENLKQNHLLF